MSGEAAPEGAEGEVRPGRFDFVIGGGSAVQIAQTIAAQPVAMRDELEIPQARRTWLLEKYGLQASDEVLANYDVLIEVAPAGVAP